jgi:hypothetical protein
MTVPHQQVGVLFTTSSAAPIVSLSLSGALNYLDPSSSKPIRSVSGHQKPINAMGTTTNLKTIFTGSYDGRVCAWDVATGDADVINETGGGVLQFTASEKAAWSISQDDVLKDIDIGKLSLGYEYKIRELMIVLQVGLVVRQRVLQCKMAIRSSLRQSTIFKFFKRERN